MTRRKAIGLATCVLVVSCSKQIGVMQSLDLAGAIPDGCLLAALKSSPIPKGANVARSNEWFEVESGLPLRSGRATADKLSFRLVELGNKRTVHVGVLWLSDRRPVPREYWESVERLTRAVAQRIAVACGEPEAVIRCTRATEEVQAENCLLPSEQQGAKP